MLGRRSAFTTSLYGVDEEDAEQPVSRHHIIFGALEKTSSCTPAASPKMEMTAGPPAVVALEVAPCCSSAAPATSSRKCRSGDSARLLADSPVDIFLDGEGARLPAGSFDVIFMRWG